MHNKGVQERLFITEEASQFAVIFGKSQNEKFRKQDRTGKIHQRLEQNQSKCLQPPKLERHFFGAQNFEHIIFLSVRPQFKEKYVNRSINGIVLQFE